MQLAQEHMAVIELRCQGQQWNGMGPPSAVWLAWVCPCRARVGLGMAQLDRAHPGGERPWEVGPVVAGGWSLIGLVTRREGRDCFLNSRNLGLVGQILRF